MMLCLHFWAWNSNQLLQMLPAPDSFSLNTNEAPTKTRSDIWLSKKIEEIFQYKGKKSISPRVRNPSKEWRRKTHEKKLKERYLSHCYVFNLFKLSRYFWLHFLLYALSWPQAASLPRTPSIPDETIHELSWQGLCSSSLQKLGFEQILASLSSFNHKCCWCASKWINSMSRYRR